GLVELIAGKMRAGRLGIRSAIAGTPEAARAASRFGRGGIIPPGGDEAMARGLPLAALELPAETTTALSRAGLKTLADLADRPSMTLSSRFGEALVTRLRRILGREDTRI